MNLFQSGICLRLSLKKKKINAKSSKLRGFEYLYKLRRTLSSNTLVSAPSGQTLLATELIIHNRCSEMFSWIYDRAQRNSQVSLWCCFFPSSVLQGQGIVLRGDVSTTILTLPPILPNTRLPPQKKVDYSSLGT